jgi:hypothetical protein
VQTKIPTKTRILGFKYSLAVVFKGHFAVLIIFPNYGPQMLPALPQPTLSTILYPQITSKLHSNGSLHPH